MLGMGKDIFSKTSRKAVGPTLPPVQYVPRVLSLVVRQPEHEPNAFPSSSAAFKNVWSYTSVTPTYLYVLDWDSFCRCAVHTPWNFTFWDVAL
jgi:hypothetical protein